MSGSTIRQKASAVLRALFPPAKKPEDGMYAVFGDTTPIACAPCMAIGKTAVYGPECWRKDLAAAEDDLNKAKNSGTVYPPSLEICRSFNGKWMTAAAYARRTKSR